MNLNNLGVSISKSVIFSSCFSLSLYTLNSWKYYIEFSKNIGSEIYIINYYSLNSFCYSQSVCPPPLLYRFVGGSNF